MSTTPARSQMGTPGWGSLAVVAYLPEPLGSFLTGLRRQLADDHNPEAHVTFLPPRVLTLPLADASLQISERLRLVAPFEVELRSMRIFPVTNMLYLDVGRGSEQSARLHNWLNRGELYAREDFEFIPHLTVSSPLVTGEAADALRRAEAAWREWPHPAKFLVNEVVLLWQPGHCTEKNWTRQSTVPLSGG